MEVEAVTRAIRWLASQHDAQITHAIILTDSMNLPEKVESGMGCPNWHTVVHSLRLQRLFVGWLLNVPATCQCISGTVATTTSVDLLC